METDEIYIYNILKAIFTYLIITIGFLFIYSKYLSNTKGSELSQSLSIIFEPIFYANNLILLFVIFTYFLYKAKEENELF
jgi:hypothetical protein